MSRTRHQLPIEVFGATVRGPAHRADGTPNQDAWGRGRAGTAHVVVVSDGMGSRPHAQDGARAACGAVLDAVRQWRRYRGAPTEVLLGLVHLLWRARIAPKAPEDCACTCLFAAIEADGSGIVAQLGDGLIVVRDGEGLSAVANRSGCSFGNETEALGTTHRTGAWAQRPLDKSVNTVVLCTDGVSDDLLQDRLAEFVDWLVMDVGREDPAARGRALRRALRDWPTPRHLDDKTIAVVHTQGIYR